MDEIYGYLPPTANPPSKKPMMTMLKQARAFGLGVLLATQNPVDLDYKALSNIGTWFLGRLQTERDKMRVLDGLAGASAGQDQAFDRKQMEERLSSLGSRVFLMNNVHDEVPEVFHVRWVMSYLRGPLSRKQIQQLMAEKRASDVPSSEKLRPADESSESTAKPAATPTAVNQALATRPTLPRGAHEYFVPAKPDADSSNIQIHPRPHSPRCRALRGR